jgi:hypothetical protein
MVRFLCADANDKSPISEIATQHTALILMPTPSMLWSNFATRTFVGRICAVALMLLVGCTGDDSKQNPDPDSSSDQVSVDIEGLRPQINSFCGGCHAVPDPKTFPRKAWYKEVEQGYKFYYKSKRDDLKAPPQAKVVAWYRAQADENLVMPVEAKAAHQSVATFELDQLARAKGVDFPAISHVYAEPSQNAATPTFLLDMFHGTVHRLQGTAGKLATSEMLPAKTVAHPAHIEKTDLNGDGEPDYLFAELGSFQPQDHQLGRVVWFDPKTKQTQNLLSKIGRIADIRPGDFDGDGDLDLIVAEFGWLETGSITFLRQVEAEGGQLKFESEKVDDRHGTIHVPVIDLNGDGHLDFVALISQEHERIVGFVNDGNGKFEKRVIFDAGDPSYGSSGIQLVDMDGDKDLDILYSNGDTLDGYYLKPYHRIQWLENKGDVKFEHHVIDSMAGVYRAVAGDIDNDGDMDIVAGAHISSDLRQSFSEDTRFDSLIWLEQTAPGKFARHPIEQVRYYGYYALNISDLDGDGDLDIVAGRHAAPDSKDPAWANIYWNKLK